MRTLYIDCTGGVSGDMILKALEEISEENERIHKHKGEAHHGRSRAEVQRILEQGKEIAFKIYEAIADAEAKVHGGTADTVHFHEVGRNEAVKNAACIGMAVAAIRPDKILVSKINDGCGFVDCAHGRIPVPVPAVKAMMDGCGAQYPDYQFGTCEDVDTEMVTPSGLAALIGIGAEPADDSGMVFLEGDITAECEAFGTRDTGKGGLRAYLIEKQQTR